MSNLTKTAINESFMKMISQKSFDKITVKDIVEDCHITRRTFYYHYQDMFALVEDILREETQIVLSRYNSADSWEDAFITASRFILENKQAVYHLYKSVHRNEIEKYVDKISTGVMKAFIDDVSSDLTVSQSDKDLVGDFYKYALTGIVYHWLDDGMKEDPEKIVRRMGKLFSGNIRHSLVKSTIITT